MQTAAEREARGRVLVVDDEPSLVAAVGRILGRAGFEVRGVDSAEAAMAALHEDGERIDVVLTDVYMRGQTGLELLSHVRAEWPDTPVIVMTGQATIDTAVEAMRSGAYDYLVKPFNPADALLVAIERALEHKGLRRRAHDLARRLELSDRFRGMIGASRAWRAVLEQVRSVAPSDATALVLGETGTGKELVARALHDESRRASRPFVAINCGALTETVLESELFGHARGAFTGAVSARRGLFEEADSGSLFLDEVGELPPAVQVKLLRVLQEGEVRRVGENAPRRVNVRVIAATHRDLAAQVRAGNFREDLYYRVNVVSISVPALRDRRDDIPLLAQHFVQKHGGDTPPRLSADALDVLMRAPWPGNVRELENAIQRALVMASGGVLDRAALEPPRGSQRTPDPVPEPAAPASEAPVLPLKEAKDAFERAYLQGVLQRSGSMAEAARHAGLDPSNFRRLLKRHDLS